MFDKLMNKTSSYLYQNMPPQDSYVWWLLLFVALVLCCRLSFRYDVRHRVPRVHYQNCCSSKTNITQKNNRKMDKHMND